MRKSNVKSLEAILINLSTTLFCNFTNKLVTVSIMGMVENVNDFIVSVYTDILHYITELQAVFIHRHRLL